MSNDDKPEDDEVGYRKPPKSGHLKKGISGNPSGRPKKRSDFASELMKELQSKVIITEKDKRKVITKSEGAAKQVANKAVSGNLPSIRLVIGMDRETQERAAEQQQNSPDKPDYEYRKATDFTSDELALIIQGIHPKYSK